MDGAPYSNRSHDYPEGLLVVDGQLNLTVGSRQLLSAPARYLSFLSASRMPWLQAVSASWSYLTYEA
jgi:hypothetical protein